MKHLSLGDKVFSTINYSLMGLLALLTLYPFWDSFIVSITPLEESMASSIHLFPKTITFEAYAFLLDMNELWTSYGVTIFVTAVGTALSMAITILAAYPLSKPQLDGRGLLLFVIVFTMLFNGGLIPTYIIVQQTGMLNSVWSLIVPTLLSTYNLIIMLNFFRSIPEELEESARIDGSSDIGILLRIVIPLSMPAIATVSLFYAVMRWNDFFTAVMYITDKDKFPLQLFLRSMLVENAASYQGGGDSPFLLGQPIKMATVMAATIPVALIYPFVQKYFVQGVTLGAIKE